MHTNASALKAAPVLLVFGASGHGRVVADAALAQGRWSGVVASDRDGSRCLGMLVPGVALVASAQAEQFTGVVHVAIGNNLHRQRESLFFLQTNGPACLASVVHPRASVSAFAHIGMGCFVAAGAVLAPACEVGMGVIVNHGAIVDHDVRVGDFSHVAPQATLGGGVVMGRRVLVGAGAVITPGMQIGDDVVVGAGAVVVQSLLEPGTYAGVPARRLS